MQIYPPKTKKVGEKNASSIFFFLLRFLKKRREKNASSIFFSFFLVRDLSEGDCDVQFD